MWSLVLQDGIKGWVKAGSKYTNWMNDYDAAAWESVQHLQAKHDL
jgi:arsenical-resistance protein 2